MIASIVLLNLNLTPWASLGVGFDPKLRGNVAAGVRPESNNNQLK